MLSAPSTSRAITGRVAAQLNEAHDDRGMVLTAGHRGHHPEHLGSGRNLLRQRIVGRLEGDVLPAGEEADEIPPLRSPVIADRPSEDRILGLQGVEHGALRRPLADVEAYFPVDARERAQVLRQDDADHDRVCASTESTEGRSCTMAVQLSPLSDDA